jgi:hypothetical protein
MKIHIAFALLLLTGPLFAGWNEYGLTLINTAPSNVEGTLKYEFKDKEGRIIYLNMSSEPDVSTMKKIIRYKNDIYAWKYITVKNLSCYLYDKGIQAVIVPDSVRYKESDLKKHLPSGFSLIEDKDCMSYRYRIIVGNTSLKLDSSYTGEEPMLDELYAYIIGIRDKKIIVEDERVISGSVVSFSRDKEQGDKSVLPVGSLHEYGKNMGTTAGATTLKKYASVRGSYLYPIGVMGDIFVGGYGFTVSGGLRDFGFSLNNRTFLRFDFEIMTGFWRLNKKEQSGEGSNRSVNNAYIIPFAVTGRYPFGITERLSIAPSAGFGYFYNKLSYNRTSPDGITENISVREWNPTVMFGLRFNYRFEKAFLFSGTDFMTMFERRLNVAALIFNMGIGYSF